MAQGKATIDHDKIKSWVEQHGGCPAHVKGSGSGDDPGILRIDFTGFSGKHTLEEISWDEFFDAFEDNKLAFLYQDDEKSRFSKLVSRDSAKLDGDGGRATKGGAKTGKKKTAASKSKSKSAVNALKLLEQQHREVEELFEKIEGAKSASQKERIFVKIADALAAHAKIEETMFYPAAFADKTESELREAVEEHLGAKRLIADLLSMEATHPQFDAKVTVLKEMIEHHVKEEEKTLFPMVRKLDVEDLDVLGSKMQQRYMQLIKTDPRNEVPKETQSAVTPF